MVCMSVPIQCICLKIAAGTGTGIIIISPTRELALQIFGVAKEVMAHHTQTFGIIMGGANRKAEEMKLVKGVNLLIATPGRLIDHLEVRISRILRDIAVYKPRSCRARKASYFAT